MFGVGWGFNRATLFFMSLESRSRFLRYLLKPFVKFCLRHHFTFQDALAVLRELFVHLAAEDIRATEAKVNASRISMITGIYREDVAKILREEVSANPGDSGLLAAVIGQWERDPDFLTAQGSPRVLRAEGEESPFHTLVTKVRRGVYPPTVLFALEKIGAIQHTQRGAKLIRGGAVTDPSSDESLDLLSRDIEAFILATEQNMARPDSIGEAYIRTEYDNISRHNLPEIRRWLVNHTKLFHKKARGYLSKFDKDLNPRLAKEDPGGERVILHAFSLSRPTPEEKPKRP